MRRQNKMKSWIGMRPQHSGELSLLQNFQAVFRDHWITDRDLEPKIIRWLKNPNKQTNPTCFPCANIIFLYCSNSQRPRRACCTGHAPSKTAFSPLESLQPIQTRDREAQNIIHPASSSQHLRNTVLPFLLKVSNASPTHRNAIFLLILSNHCVLHRRSLKAHKHRAAQASLSPSSLQSLRELHQSDTLHILWCRTMNHTTLSFSLHFPIASHFPGAIEALKRRLAFRWQNIEKVKAVRHNAAIHGAHQLPKCHSFFLMTKATAQQETN